MDTSLSTNQNGKMGFLNRVVKLFTSPGEVFWGLREKPDFIWPVIFIIVSLGFSLPISGFTRRILLASFPKLPAAMKGHPTNAALSLIGGFVGLCLLLLIVTGLYYLAAKIAGGQSVRFLSALSIFGYVNIAQTLHSIYLGLVILITGVLPPVGLDIIMGVHERLFTPLGIFLSMLNPFGIGYLILNSIALEKGFKLSRGKAVFITVLFWGAVVALNTLSALSFNLYK